MQMSVRLLGSIWKAADFGFFPMCSQTLLNWLKSKEDSNHVKFCMTNLSLLDIVPVLCLKSITPTLVLDSHIYLWRHVLSEREKTTWLLWVLSEDYAPFPQTFQYSFSDLFHINLNQIWKWVIRAVYHVQKNLGSTLYNNMNASVTLKKIYLQCILGLSRISCGSVTLEAHICFSA